MCIRIKIFVNANTNTNKNIHEYEYSRFLKFLKIIRIRIRQSWHIHE